MRVLLSEASSLTARETLTVLGREGVDVEAVTGARAPIVRFSRWCRHLHAAPEPSVDPLGYLRRVAELLATRRFDAVLPTHEQAWLLSVGRPLLPPAAPLVISTASAFDRVQGKIAFARTANALGLPQPDWSPVTSMADVAAFGTPCWLKANHATAGRGVIRVPDPNAIGPAWATMITHGQPLMAQRPAAGQYAQAAGLFGGGRLVAAHCSELVGEGAGGSAAARRGVDHPAVRQHLIDLGNELGWSGGLTLDYFHIDGVPSYIECNPRTVEPGNAAASGVSLPSLTIALTQGDTPREPIYGRPDARTHSSMALMLGSVVRGEGRRTAMQVLTHGLMRRGAYRNSIEVLTPITEDPPSLIPVAAAAGVALAGTAAADRLAADTVRAYQVTPEAIAAVRVSVNPDT